jgi:MFS family permease
MERAESSRLTMPSRPSAWESEFFSHTINLPFLHMILISNMPRFQRRVLWAAGLCFTADSTEIMLLSFLSLTLQSEWELTANQTASMTACVFAGSLVGTLTFGFLGDHWGRRPTFLMACFFISVFGLLTAFATDYASLLGIRFIVGFG